MTHRPDFGPKLGLCLWVWCGPLSQLLVVPAKAHLPHHFLCWFLVRVARVSSFVGAEYLVVAGPVQGLAGLWEAPWRAQARDRKLLLHEPRFS